MATNYTGDPVATQAPSPAPGSDVEPVFTLVDDGDALNAASVAQEFKCAADFIAWLTNHGMWFDVAARTVTVGHTFNGASGDTNAALITTATPTTRKFLWDINSGTQRVAIYKTDGTLEVVTGATWSGTQWVKDATAFAHKWVFADQSFGSYFVNGGVASPFNDGAWLLRTFNNDAGALTSESHIVSTSGNVRAALGNVVATAGNVVADVGNVEATAGNVRAPHFVGIGTAPTAVCGTGAGGGPPAATVSGTDASGQVSFTAGAGAATTATIFTLTFNAVYAAAPKCVAIQPANAATAALWDTATPPYVIYTNIAAGSFILTSGSVALTNGAVYVFYYSVMA